mmetsp:Transcript_63252/g.179916  ORF Transcript_63252/g.179916 Transcript_63252/m.179916 type:complete len:209 (+) Transcript_63252:678-1304(+)
MLSAPRLQQHMLEVGMPRGKTYGPGSEDVPHGALPQPSLLPLGLQAGTTCGATPAAPDELPLHPRCPGSAAPRHDLLEPPGTRHRAPPCPAEEGAACLLQAGPARQQLAAAPSRQCPGPGGQHTDGPDLRAAGVRTRQCGPQGLSVLQTRGGETAPPRPAKQRHAGGVPSPGLRSSLQQNLLGLLAKHDPCQQYGSLAMSSRTMCGCV